MSKLLYITIVLLCIWLVWSNKYEHYISYDKNIYIHNVQLIELLKKDIKIYDDKLAIAYKQYPPSQRDLLQHSKMKQYIISLS
jgi:hypothetical protein